ncbi:MAG: HpcH/HpaI aldolase/citrate lyase family protein, partial [Burkholderiaceae bacterium]
ATAEFLRSLPQEKTKVIIVRVNAVSTQHFATDVEAIAVPALDMINVPLIESAEDVRRVVAVTGDIPLIANIETPKGLRCAAEIAVADPSVAGLQLGFGDLLEPLGIDRYNPPIVLQIQLAMRLAAGEAGVFAYDSVYSNVHDDEGLKHEAEGARKLGYIGKSVIHPRQVPIVNAVFRPSADEIAHSLKVVESVREAKAKGVGAWMVDGKMIDAPFVKRAENTLALAQRLGLL